eukprot:TRINITY_DN3368_c0_g2_i3.p1 TRINITY_DN3368_c0_g2~~TRINITY_DN3368_c0_g2_i3.p1  ORF type:complete len:114 (-),score=18.58 TRINITY_DN3368_c0_g2_i3:157-498(-)
MVGLSDGTLLSASEDKTIREWDINRAQDTIVCRTIYNIICIALLRDGSIFTGSSYGKVEIRKTCTSSQESTLVNLCCQLIAVNNSNFDMTALEQNLPRELYDAVSKLLITTTK